MLKDKKNDNDTVKELKDIIKSFQLKIEDTKLNLKLKEKYKEYEQKG